MVVSVCLHTLKLYLVALGHLSANVGRKLVGRGQILSMLLPAVCRRPGPKLSAGAAHIVDAVPVATGPIVVAGPSMSLRAYRDVRLTDRGPRAPQEIGHSIAVVQQVLVYVQQG